MADAGLVMQGALGLETSIDDVLAVVGASRQWLEVVLHDEQRARGSILCKSGQVVHAFAAPDRRGVDAFRSLRSRPGRGFAVYQRAAPPDRAEPLGSLADLLALVTDVGASTTQNVVLEGSFEDFGIREVLDVLSFSRQALELVATRADGSRVVLVAKAGRVLACDDPGGRRSGLDAFHALLRGPGQRFRVTRRDNLGAFGEPLGILTELLAAPRPEVVRATADHVSILEGTFAETSLEEVLEVVGLTRQLVELVFRDGARVRGTILVKAGRVVDARSARSGASGPAAVTELLRDPGRAFSVERRTEPVGRREPLGSLADLSRHALRGGSASGSTGPVRELVLEGRFATHPMIEVLRTLSLSRQHLVLLLRAGGRTNGRLSVKAGRVLEAEHGGRRGTASLPTLLADPGESWVVYRMPPGTPLPEPIDHLDALLARLAPPSPPLLDRDDDAQPTVVMVATPGWTPRAHDPHPEAPRVAPPLPSPATVDGLDLPVPARPPSLADPGVQLDARLAELTAAITSLERTLSRSGPGARAEQAFAAIALLQITTLVIGAAALLFRILAG